MNKLNHLPSAATKSFNATINLLSSQNSHTQVLNTFSSMLKSNVPPDSYTFPSILKACTSFNLFSLGISIHQSIIVNGLSSDSYISSSLINFYAKFGCVDSARKVFDYMPERNVVPWSAIIKCYSRAGEVDMAFWMFDGMRQQGVEVGPVTLLGILSGVSDVFRVRCLHGCALKYGFELDLALVNCLVSLYGKCGSLLEARELFELMEQRDIVSWNSLVSGYAQVGEFGKVMEVLRRMRVEMIKLDQQTFGCLVSAVMAKGDIGVGKVVHGLILRHGYILDTQLQTSLCYMYLKCGDADYASLLFEQTPYKDVVSWTAMISGLVQIDCADKALDVFSEMIRSGVTPSTATIASALAACAHLGSLDLGTSVHGHILRKGLKLDIPAQNSLITMYAKCGYLKQSTAVFDKIEVKDVVSWNAIVSGYAQSGHLNHALVLFSKMRTTLQRPDHITIVSLLQACASLGALHQGRWIHNFIIRNCLGPDIMIETALIDMYSKCGDLGTAKRCFDAISQHDLISWSTIISGYGTHGKGMNALKLFSEFLCAGIEPNHVIFLSVLSACSHNGLVDEGMRLFQSMTEDFGITPKLEHQACIVDLLCRAGKVEEAYNFYKRMFTEPVIDVLGIILDACRAKGKREIGDKIAEDLLVSQPVNAEHYVQLAHIYASMNKWDGVGEAWTQMRSLGLKKLPGWSFIELHGMITTFFMDHSSHPQFEEITLLLKSLGGEISKTSLDLEIDYV